MGHRFAIVLGLIYVSSCAAPEADTSSTTSLTVFGLPIPASVRDLWKDFESRHNRAVQLIENRRKCEQLGGTNCEIQAIICTFQKDAFDKYNEAHGGVVGGGLFGDPLDVFKSTCGGLDCFACCHTPHIPGCWSALPSDSGQSFNCNGLTYRPGTGIVGSTLVTGFPTGSTQCLGAQLTCDHIPLCTGGDPSLTTSLLDRLSSFPSPYLMTASQRSFAASGAASTNPQYAAAMINLLNNYPASRDKAPVFDAITARGFAPQPGVGVPASWMAALDTLEPFDFTFGTPGVDAFAIARPNNGGLDVPSSYLAAITTFLDLRAIESVPNLAARFASVESRVWSKPDADAALAAAGITDPDAELRKTMGGFMLEALKQTSQLQDYRLLAIPVNEPAQPTMFGGYQLSKPPTATLAPSVSGSSLALGVTIIDPLHVAGQAGVDPISIDWGDGSSSNFDYDLTKSAATYAHSYATAGNKLVHVTAMNASGLRGVTGEVVAIAQAAAAVNSTTLSTVRVDDVRFYAHLPLDTGRAVVYLDGVDDAGRVIEIGESEDLRVNNLATGPSCGGPDATCSNNVVSCSNGARPTCSTGQTAGCASTSVSSTAVCYGIAAQSFGTIVGHNTTGAHLTALRLRPIAYQNTGTTGAIPIITGDGIYFTVGNVSLDARGPGGVAATTSFPVTPADVQLFTAGGPVAPVIAFDGRVRLSVQGQDPTVPCAQPGAAQCGDPNMPVLTRIEIPLAGHALPSIASALDALAAPLPVGQPAYWVEDRPGRLVLASFSNGAAVASTAATDVTDYDRATLEPTLVGLRIVPPPSGLGIGGVPHAAMLATSQQFSAFALYSDGSTFDVTHDPALSWTSSSSAITITASETATGTQPSPATTAIDLPPGPPDLRAGVSITPGGVATLAAAPADPITIGASYAAPSGTVTATATGVFVAGKVSPGGVGAIGTWSIGGTFTLAAGETLHVDCSGASYDQIVVAGPADLGNATLEVSDAPCGGATSIITARGITGRFRGLPDGAIVRTASGHRFALHYSDTAVTLARTHADLIAMEPASGQWWAALSNGVTFATQLFASWSADQTRTCNDSICTGIDVTWVDQRVGDFDGDGRDDVIARYKETGTWWLALSAGAAAAPATLFATWAPDSVCTCSEGICTGTNLTWVDVQVADFDGDGRADVAARVKETGQWWVSLSRGTTSAPPSLFTTWNNAVTWVDVHVGDFDGDGKADLVGRVLETGNWFVSLSGGATSTRFALFATWSAGAPWTGVQIADVDGDGLADIVGMANGAWWVTRNAGWAKGATPITYAYMQWSNGPGVTWVDQRVADFNGDGLPDVAARWLEGGRWYVTYNGGGAATPAFGAGTTVNIATWSTGVHWVATRVGDFDGDGRADIAARVLESGQWWVAVTDHTGASPAATSTLWATWVPGIDFEGVASAEMDGH